MIRLDLTQVEADQLQQALAGLVSQADTEDVVVAGQRLLTKLAAACQQESAPQHCPVCQCPFTPRPGGRLARYCSNACKQKAYRRRRLERQRQWRPTWLRKQRTPSPA